MAAAVPPARDFRLRTPDGVVLTATYRPGARDDAPAVLFLHGVNASRAGFADNAAWLAARGYATLTIDLRGHGESSLRPRSFGWRESVDAATAFSWPELRRRGARVAVVGISMGGAAALLGPHGPLPADALILQVAYPNVRHAIRNRIAARLGSAPAVLLELPLSLQTRLRIGVWPDKLAPLRRLKRYKGPVLVIGGLEDRYTPPDETRAMAAAARAGSRLWLSPTGGHAAVCSISDDAYRSRLLTFLRKTIGGPPRSEGGVAPRSLV